MKLPITGPYTAKDQLKSDRATCFIGRGSERSSTRQYALAWGERANKGLYSPEDVVFVSAEGARFGALQPDFKEIRAAMEVGASFITDDAPNRARAYNSGERMVATYLQHNGYTETKPGLWTLLR
jgi:hypothetical protein